MNGPAIRYAPTADRDWRAHCRDCSHVRPAGRDKPETARLKTWQWARRHAEMQPGHRVVVTHLTEQEIRCE